MEIFETGSNYRLHGLNISHKIKENAIELSGPVSPDMRVEVCFLRFPPGFPAAPQNFSRVFIGSGPLHCRAPYHNDRRNNIIQNRSKSCIFIDVDFLFGSGSTHQTGEP
jgi:hypothetical protein